MNHSLLLAHTYTQSNAPRRRAVLAAAGVDDWLIVIETAKGKFLPDGLSLIPLGLPQTEKRGSTKNINTDEAPVLPSLSLLDLPSGSLIDKED